MWRQDDLFRSLVGTLHPGACATPTPTCELIRDAGRRARASIGLPACPLMHGTGLLHRSSSCCPAAGRTVTLESRNLDVEELLDTIEREKVNTIAIVGDAFAKPMLRALDADARPLGPLEPRVMIVSSGVMFSEDVQAGAARATTPAMMIVDAFSLVRGARHGPVGVAARRARRTTAKFTLGENTKVITDDGREVRARLGRDRPGGRRRLAAGRLLQGRGQVGGHLHHDRRQALLRARRLRHGRGRRLAHAARPRLGVHQHRRREGVPRGGRGGAQDPRRGASTPSPSACPTRSSARPSPPWSSWRPAPTLDEGAIIAHVKDKLAAYKAPKRVLADRHHRPGPERQGRLQAAQGVGRRRARGAAVVTRAQPQELRVGYHRDLDAITRRWCGCSRWCPRRWPRPTRRSSATTPTRWPACEPARRRSTS